jgi:hypothetical protein
VVLIEGDHSIKEVHEQIVAAVTERLSRLGAGAHITVPSLTVTGK